jgi:hypothetical protein
MHLGDPGRSKRTKNKGKAKATAEDIEVVFEGYVIYFAIIYYR